MKIGGGGGQKYTFLERSLYWEPYELQEKSFCGRSLKFDVTYQPQTEMLLLLHLWKELLQIGFEAISESWNQKLSTLCQKMFELKFKISQYQEFQLPPKISFELEQISKIYQ